MRSFIGWWVELYAYNFKIHYLFICLLISLESHLRVIVKQWCMVFDLLWTLILIGWCCRWMSQMPSTQFHIESSFKSFAKLAILCHSFFVLFDPFYAQHLPLYFSHHYPSIDFSVITFFISTHQGDLLASLFFTFLYFHTCSFSHFAEFDIYFSPP